MKKFLTLTLISLTFSSAFAQEAKLLTTFGRLAVRDSTDLAPRAAVLSFQSGVYKTRTNVMAQLLQGNQNTAVSTGDSVLNALFMDGRNLRLNVVSTGSRNSKEMETRLVITTNTNDKNVLKNLQDDIFKTKLNFQDISKRKMGPVMESTKQASITLDMSDEGISEMNESLLRLVNGFNDGSLSKRILKPTKLSKKSSLK